MESQSMEPDDDRRLFNKFLLGTPITATILPDRKEERIRARHTPFLSLFPVESLFMGR